MCSNRHTNTHDHQESGAESTQIQNRRAGALDEVVWVRAVAAYPVGHGRQHVGGDNEQRVIRLPEGAGQDDEEEADCQHEGEGDYCFEACGGHFELVMWEAGVEAMALPEYEGFGIGIARGGCCLGFVDDR